MKQMIMAGPKKSKIIEVDVPEINDGQILVKVKYTGICHSELFPWQTANPGDVLGHEAMGHVAKVGKNVHGFSVGDRVTGLGGGGYKEYIVMEPGKTFIVPDNLKDEDAVVEPLACMMSVVERIDRHKLGDTLVVVGTGYMGLGTISLLKARGYARVIAVDERKIALQNALRYGADEIYLPDQLPLDFKLNWKTWESPDLTRDGHKTDIFHTGFENVIEFTGTESGLCLAGEMVCAHGNLGIAGYHNDGLRTVDFKLWNLKAMNMYNCHERRIDYEATLCARALRLISQGQWKFTGAATHIYPLDDFDAAQEDMANHSDNYIKGLVDCD